jgi:fatty-acyl-CoA synthase
VILGDILRKNARPEIYGNHLALIFDARRWSYAALNAWVNCLANALLAEGVRRGDRVAVLGRNSDTYVALYFALAKLGAIMVPVNFWYRAEETRYVLDQSECRWLIAERRFAPVALAARAAVAGTPAIYWYGPAEASERSVDAATVAPEGMTDPFGHDLERLAAAASSGEPPVAVRPEDPHIILYTSGTTGFPKGATFSHRAHYLHAVALALQTAQTDADVGLVVYPLFHTGGPDCVVLPHFLVGATVVVQDGADPVTILTAAQEHRLTSIFCVPTVWRWLIAELARQPYDVSSVQRCLGSSDTFPPDLLSGILEHFPAEVRVTYGLTEAGCILTYSRLTRTDTTKINTVGKPHPLVEVRIVDAEGRDVSLGEVGEIVARGPTLMDGYWNQPERTAEAMRDGWLHTGDLGRFDADGYVIIAGRLKDMIVSGGEKIYPVEVEKLLRQHPAIQDAALVGVPNREWGQAVLAVVVRRSGATLTADEVIAFVGSRLAGFKRPRFVEFVDALPVTAATNKVQKGVLRDRFGPRYAEKES